MTAIISESLRDEIMKEAFAKYDKCFQEQVDMYVHHLVTYGRKDYDTARAEAECLALAVLGPKIAYK